jgi:hypothetical protein
VLFPAEWGVMSKAARCAALLMTNHGLGASVLTPGAV